MFEQVTRVVHALVTECVCVMNRVYVTTATKERRVMSMARVLPPEILTVVV